MLRSNESSVCSWVIVRKVKCAFCLEKVIETSFNELSFISALKTIPHFFHMVTKHKKTLIYNRNEK